VGPLNVILWLGGALLVVIAYARGKRPWRRYRALKEQDEQVARYAAWRGSARDDSTIGASGAMEILRRQARLAGLVAAFGVALIVVGFLVR
jgi:hypothetical protein